MSLTPKGLNDWLTTNKLRLNIAKTEFMLSRQRIKTLNNEIDIEINCNNFGQSSYFAKISGCVHLDNHLMWSEHTYIKKLCKKLLQP